MDPFFDDLPDLDPVISYEKTGYGWRGITSHGDVLEVKASNGVPSSIVVACNGRPIGRRIVTNDVKIDIDDYLLHFNRVVDLYKANKVAQALEESDATLAAAPTLRARYNRSMVLLAMGRWKEGLAEYWTAEQSEPFIRPQVKEAIAAGLRPWMGESLEKKRLLLLHAHGFGDTIMCLRYVGGLRGAVVVVPPETERIASQCGVVSRELIDADYFCPLLHLLHFLGVNPSNVSGKSYLNSAFDRALSNKWHLRIAGSKRKKIGLAWSIGKPSKGDYPREIELKRLVDALGDEAELYSVQSQLSDQAADLGVTSFTFDDFADCAAMMRYMDEIISVDTAALHLAGAIGHRKVFGLLSHWASWRWIAPWYDNVRLLRQASPGDWASALDQR